MHDEIRFRVVVVQSPSPVRLFATLGLQHARPPWPSPFPGVYPNSCPLSRWCHPTISSSVVSFSSWPQSFPASGSYSNASALRNQVAKVLEFQLQHQSLQWTPRTTAGQVTWKGVQHHYSKCKAKPQWDITSYLKIRMALIRKIRDNKCWWECGERGIWALLVGI